MIRSSVILALALLAGTGLPAQRRALTFDDLKDLSQAQAIQIDHVVPLAEAWASGADEWTDEERRTYANDLSELLAVDGPTNASKGDDDPAAWRPRKGAGSAPTGNATRRFAPGR